MKNIILAIISLLSTCLFAQKSITLTPIADDGIGFHLATNAANKNYSTDLWNIAHTQDGAFNMGIDTGRTLMLFDFNNLPKGLVIKKITISLFAYPAQAGPTYYGHFGQNNACVLQRIVSPWTLSAVTWNKRPMLTSNDQVILPKSTSQFQDYKDIDVTALFLPMIQNSNQNFGVEMKLIEEIPKNVLIFCSTNYTDKSKHPTLTVFYEEDSTAIITNPTTNNNNNTTAKDTICESQERFFVPNSFSPNEDGINDYFTIYASKNFTINYFRIFDRWGNLIFEKENFLCNDDAQGWNGDFRDKKANQGTYTCIVKVTDDKKCTKMIKSSIDLLR